MQNYLKEQNPLEKINSDDIKRFYMDLNGFEEYSFDYVEQTRKEVYDICADINTFYYMDKEEGFKDNIKRTMQRFHHMKKKGVHDDRLSPGYRVLHEGFFKLDYGMMYLHRWAFEPIIELLGSEE